MGTSSRRVSNRGRNKAPVDDGNVLDIDMNKDGEVHMQTDVDTDNLNQRENGQIENQQSTILPADAVAIENGNGHMNIDVDVDTSKSLAIGVPQKDPQQDLQEESKTTNAVVLPAPPVVQNGHGNENGNGNKNKNGQGSVEDNMTAVPMELDGNDNSEVDPPLPNDQPETIIDVTAEDNGAHTHIGDTPTAAATEVEVEAIQISSSSDEINNTSNQQDNTRTRRRASTTTRGNQNRSRSKSPKPKKAKDSPAINAQLKLQKQKEKIRDAIQQMIQMVEYELSVDPYRGLFDDEVNRGNGDKNGNMFVKCSNGLSFDSQRQEMEVNIGMKKDKAEDMNDDANQCSDAGVQILDPAPGQNRPSPNIPKCACPCPCVQKWIEEARDKQIAALEKSKKRKRRSTGIGSGKGSRGKSKSKSRAKKRGKNKETDVLVEDANVNVDADVVILESSSSLQTATVAAEEPASAAASSVDGNPNPPAVELEDKPYIQIRRNPSSAYTCACDYNPFCLASIGGAMDDYLNDRLFGQGGTGFCIEVDGDGDAASATKNDEKSQVVESRDYEKEQQERDGLVDGVDGGVEISKIIEKARIIEVNENVHELVQKDKEMVAADADNSITNGDMVEGRRAQLSQTHEGEHEIEIDMDVEVLDFSASDRKSAGASASTSACNREMVATNESNDAKIEIIEEQENGKTAAVRNNELEDATRSSDVENGILSGQEKELPNPVMEQLPVLDQEVEHIADTDSKNDASGTNTRKMHSENLTSDQSAAEVIEIHPQKQSKRSSTQAGDILLHMSTNPLTRGESPVSLLSIDANTEGVVPMRRAIQVDLQNIMEYLDNIIPSSEPGRKEEEIDEFVKAAQKWNSGLIYDKNDSSDGGGESGNGQPVGKDGKFIMCKPVGIVNLGATCYLNSQLQCLSANLAFLHGVFSWAPNSKAFHDDSLSNLHSSRMDLVISSMQSLLARMVHGAQSVVCTSSFSSAMELEKDEQQDPNEFARLLFDRMHESFQKISITDMQSESSGLQNLLPNIFRGVFEYSTKCNSCGSISKRDGHFMDLTLPIGTDEASNVSSSGKALTLNHLLEDYLMPEKMDGENKYRCSACNDACEAERKVDFAKTPPVLNIQLARYIYDAKTMRKKKLVKPILLPHFLHITRNDGETPKYILCAVQNHIGTSAYTGHYIAEVMDWVTGTWFEFDDQKVKLLRNGPTSSYDPNRTLTTRLKGGTPDAYNLFYVETSFLLQSVRKQVSTMSIPTKGIVADISLERKHTFELQREIRIRQQKISGRLNRRRNGILKMLKTAPLGGATKSATSSVWVDGSTLRRFASCTDLMDDLLSNLNEPILRHSHLVCEHGIGLHPRIARSGKILSSEQFQIYCDLLSAEREEIAKDKGGEGVTRAECSAPVCDLVINRDAFLRCEQCAINYQAELKEKLSIFKRLASIYDDLDPAIDILPVDGNQDLYAISRSFATNFHKTALQKFMVACTTTLNPLSDDTPVTGIDHYDFSNIIEAVVPASKVQDSSKKKKENTFDPLVNSKITCEHGNSNKMHNKQSVRFVTKNTWENICFLFPAAVALPANITNGKAQNCSLCFEEKERKAKLPVDLAAWANKSALGITKEENRLTVDTGFFRLVHKGDLKVWKSSVETVKKCRKRDALTWERMKKQLIGNLFEGVCISERHEKNLFSANVRRLTCNEHCKPFSLMKKFRSSLSTPTKTAEEDAGLKEKPTSLISEEIHSCFVESMFELYNIIMESRDTSPCNLESARSFFDKHHPQVNVKKDNIEHVADFVLEPCNEPICREEYYKCHVCSEESKDRHNVKDSKDKKATASPEVKVWNDDLCFEIHEFDGSIESEQVESMLEKEFIAKFCTGEAGQQNVRRSARKRETASNTIFTIFGKKSDSLAQFWLRVYERSNNKQISTHELSLFSFNEKERKGIMIGLTEASYEKSMETVLSCLPVKVPLDKTIYIVLTTAMANKRRRSNEDDGSLFEVLLQIVTDGQSPAVTARGRKKQRKTEKGFAGTFLQSTFCQMPGTFDTPKGQSGKTKLNDAISIDHSEDEGSPSQSPIKIPNVSSNSTGLEGGRKLPPSPSESGLKADGIIKNFQVTSVRRDIEHAEDPECCASDDCDGYKKQESQFADSLATIYNLGEEKIIFKDPSNLDSTPAIPSYIGELTNLTASEVKNLMFSLKTGEVGLVRQTLQFDDDARNLYRNFIDTEIVLAAGTPTGLPLSRREMDIVLYFLHKNDEAGVCAMFSRQRCHNLLIPYRKDNSMRYIFQIVKKQRIARNPEYKEYMTRVCSCVGKIFELEQRCRNNSL